MLVNTIKRGPLCVFIHEKELCSITQRDRESKADFLGRRITWCPRLRRRRLLGMGSEATKKKGSAFFQETRGVFKIAKKKRRPKKNQRRNPNGQIR